MEKVLLQGEDMVKEIKLFVYVYIINSGTRVKIYLEDLDLKMMTRLNDFNRGSYVHFGNKNGVSRLALAISNDGIYCEGATIPSSDKKFKAVIHELWELSVMYNWGLITLNNECPGFATIFLYGKECAGIHSENKICLDCKLSLTDIPGSQKKSVCTNCRSVHSSFHNNENVVMYRKTKKKMSEGSFSRLLKNKKAHPHLTTSS